MFTSARSAFAAMFSANCIIPACEQVVVCIWNVSHLELKGQCLPETKEFLKILLLSFLLFRFQID